MSHALNDVIVISPDVRIWSGRKKLRPEDDELAALMEECGAGNFTLGLSGALYQEVASESREFARQSLVGRYEVTQKFMRPVRAIREKLVELSFLDPGIERPPLTATP